jgi:hypothetical protein
MIIEGIIIVCALAIFYFVAMPLLWRFGTSTYLKPRELLVLRGFASTHGISEVRLRSIVIEGLAAQQFADKADSRLHERALKEMYLGLSGATPAAQEAMDVLAKMGLGHRALRAFAAHDCGEGIEALSGLMQEEKRRSLRARIARVVHSKE